MMLIIQRVKSAKIRIDQAITASIQTGLLVLTGIARADTQKDADYLANKVVGLRIFPGEGGKMDRDVMQAGGEILIVSNFTLYGDCSKGKRPAFDKAAPPAQARELYDYFVEKVRAFPLPVRTGVFQAHMLVETENDGPVTLICESPQKKKGGGSDTALPPPDSNSPVP